jgi:hypothetical protein
LRERLLAVAVLVVGIIFAVGSLRHSDTTGMHPDVYWAMKAGWRHCADTVVAGDSRVYRAIAPQAIGAALPAHRVLNYGFSSVAYTPDYLDAIEQVLDPAAGRRRIVLGITPYSLTPKAARQNRFKEERHKPALSALTGAFFGELGGRFLEPVPLNEKFLDSFRVRKGPRYLQEFRADGWVASRRVPEDVRIALKPYREEAFVENRVDDALVNVLLRRVEAWTAAGIPVYGFRPPTTTAMLELEAKRSGFDEAAFVAGFRRAGGRWIALGQTAYRSYDGSHLRLDAAVQCSTDLAAAIARLERPPAIPP